MANLRPIKVEDALQFCLFDFCSSDNPRFRDLLKIEGKDQVQNFMIRYWEKLEEYEKCSAIMKKISYYGKMD